jgi:hypothetical protein
VIFVAGNPNAIANQFASAVNSADVTRAVAGLLRRGELTAATDAENALTVAGRRQEAIVLDIDVFSKWLAQVTSEAPTQEARDRVSGLVRQIDGQLQGR